MMNLNSKSTNLKTKAIQLLLLVASLMIGFACCASLHAQEQLNLSGGNSNKAETTPMANSNRLTVDELLGNDASVAQVGFFTEDRNWIEPTVSSDFQSDLVKPTNDVRDRRIVNDGENNTVRRTENSNPTAQQANAYSVRPNANDATSGTRATDAFSNVEPTHHVSTQPAQTVYNLRNTNYEQFEQRLLSTWGERLSGTSLDSENRLLRIMLPATKTAKNSSMLFDRRASQLVFEGDPDDSDAWLRTMSFIDFDDNEVQTAVRVVDLRETEKETIQQVAFNMGGVQQDQGKKDDETVMIPLGQQNQDQQPRVVSPDLLGNVRISFIDELGVIVLQGNKEDVEKVEAAIRQFIGSSDRAKPLQKVVGLENAQSTAISEVIQEIYDDQYQDREGPVTIRPIQSPNGLLVIGREGGIQEVESLAQKLDLKEIGPAAGAEEFLVYPLKHMAAADAKQRIDEYFGQATQPALAEPPAPPAPVYTIADFRSNTLIIRASGKYRAQVTAILKAIDTDDSEAKRTVQVFPIRNALADDLANILQDILNGAFSEQQGLSQSQNQNQGQQNQGQNQNLVNRSSIGATQLDLVTPDGQIPGGVLFDVRVTADTNSNSVIVSAPEKSMKLIAELVKQLDKIPDAQSQIKVFEVINGDASDLLDMLQQLFGADQNQGAQGGQGANLSTLPLQSDSATSGSSLINIRFAVDERTNTIIASGSAGDLEVVESLLNRLDVADMSQRQVNVYRLSNLPVLDVEEALNSWLTQRQEIIDNDPATIGDINQFRNRIVVVSEVNSNSLIVTALPQYFPEIEHVIKALDRRPPMVKVKVLLAQLALGHLEEFGVQGGIQDSAVFNAMLDDVLGTQFVDLPNVAGQVLSDLNIGRSNTRTGNGGFVLSAGSESVNFLLRALREKDCLTVLSKPHMMTIENLRGSINIGQLVPRIQGVIVTGIGTTQNDVQDVPVGVNLQITPRVSPDGMIVMFIDVTKSSVDNEAQGVVIGFDSNNNPVTSQPIRETTARTAIMARSGQTVVFSGLLEETKNHAEVGMPILSDLPVFGPLFKVQTDVAARSELLIILTPYIVDGNEELDSLNRAEIERMHWCESDVAEIYGDPNIRGGNYFEQTPKTFYPDSDPLGDNPELIDSAWQQDGNGNSTENSSAIELPQTNTPLSRASMEGQMSPIDYRVPRDADGIEMDNGVPIDDAPFNPHPNQRQLDQPSVDRGANLYPPAVDPTPAGLQPTSAYKKSNRMMKRLKNQN